MPKYILIPVLFLIIFSCKKTSPTQPPVPKIDSVKFDTVLYGNGNGLYGFTLPQQPIADSILIISQVTQHDSVAISRTDAMYFNGLTQLYRTSFSNYNLDTVIKFNILPVDFYSFTGTDAVPFSYLEVSTSSSPDTILISIIYYKKP